MPDDTSGEINWTLISGECDLRRAIPLRLDSLGVPSKVTRLPSSRRAVEFQLLARETR